MPTKVPRLPSRHRTPCPPVDHSVIKKAVATLRRELSDSEILDFEAAMATYSGGDTFAALVDREARLIREAREPGRNRKKVAYQ